MKMPKSRPQPPRPDRRRSIRGSFSWIDHRFLCEGFDEGLTRLEKLLYFVLVAVSNQDGVSFYSDARLSKRDRKSTRLNSSHQIISYAVFCLKKKKSQKTL